MTLAQKESHIELVETGRKQNRKERTLAAFRDTGRRFSIDSLMAHLNVSRRTAQPALSELYLEGYINDSGQRDGRQTLYELDTGMRVKRITREEAYAEVALRGGFEDASYYLEAVKEHRRLSNEGAGRKRYRLRWLGKEEEATFVQSTLF